MSDNRWSADRRTFIKTSGAVGVAGLAGCAGDEGGADDTGDDTSDDGTVNGEADDVPEVEIILNPA